MVRTKGKRIPGDGRQRWLLGAIVLLLPLLATAGSDNPSAVIGSSHDLSVSGGGPVASQQPQACIFCHGSHLPTTGRVTVSPLWNRDLPTTEYTDYASSTYDAAPGDLSRGLSRLCLSCHDGTIALGQTLSRGRIPTRGSLSATTVSGGNMAADHPVGIQPVDDGQLVPSLFTSSGRSADPAVKLYDGRVECTTCHNPHEPARDPVGQNFLVRSNDRGALCLACHDPDRPQPNALTGWPQSAHATATNSVSTNAYGPYGTVDANACSNCHLPHSFGASGYARLLRGKEESSCASCHRSATITPAIPNVMSEFAKPYAHPTTTLSGLHDPVEKAFPLDNNRHAECPDCHQPHAAQSSKDPIVPPAVQLALTGTSGFDGLTALRPAASEYEVCFKCHASSQGKPQSSVGYSVFGYNPLRQAERGAVDPKDLSEKFGSNLARHNVTQGRRLSSIEVPSLRPFIQYPNGSRGRSLALGTFIYCTDCHASDNARRSGGSGANGPHGSAYPHILTARYEQELPGVSPGGIDTQGVNYMPGPSGTYALCNMCHDVENSILQDNSFTEHREHVLSARTSCATCHDPHGIHEEAGNSVSNFRLVSFDLNIVGPSDRGALSYDSLARECYLTCHGEHHDPKRY